jgi:hypothetical protein
MRPLQHGLEHPTRLRPAIAPIEPAQTDVLGDGRRHARLPGAPIEQ